MTTYDTLPIIVGHQDTLLHLYLPESGGEGRSFFVRSAKGHVDLPRAREGGMAGGFFAIFVPEPCDECDANGRQMVVIQTENGYEIPYAPAIDPSYARGVTITMMANLFRLVAESEGQVRVVHTVEEVEYCLTHDIHIAIMHMEGVEGIDANLDTLEVFNRVGLRSLGVVWSRPNIFAQGVPFKFPHSPDTGPGLTGAGRELVRGCNRLGIMLDLSHLNEQGFWDVAALSDAPLVATHSNVHAICPSTRNLTDKQLDAIKETEGLVGLNFGVDMLREDGHHEADTPLETMVRHIDYLVEHLGIDCVGFGSDFDGAKIPRAIGDVTNLPRLVSALVARGYDDVALHKITHENWLRVLHKTWRE